MSKPCKKPCSSDKVCNTKTGRCVLRRGTIGKKILEKNNTSGRSRSRRLSKRSRRSRRSRRSSSAASKDIVIDSILHPPPVVNNLSLSLVSSKDGLNYKDIYLNTKDRLKISMLIQSELNKISKEYGEDCITGDDPKLLRNLDIIKLLGTGTFGNVYSGCLPKHCGINSYKFAIKLSSFLSKSHYKYPYDENKNSWNEFFIMKNYINPLVEKNICPNLPLIIDSFVCKSCNFVEGKPRECIINIMELADGDMDHWFTVEKRTEDEIYSALFQIMAGIHAIQFHCQIINRDIKAPNILYYKVTPGGYWHYVIHGFDFFIPNYGHMFIINDFGVSSIKDPLSSINKWNSFSLTGMIINNKYSTFNPQICLLPGKGEKIDKESIKKCQNHILYTYILQDGIPTLGKNISMYKSSRSYIKKGKIMDCEIVFTEEQKRELQRLGIPSNSGDIKFYQHPEIIPPYEFSIDTQDCIRIFNGRQRVAIFPRVNHKMYDVPTNVVSILDKYDDKYVRSDHPSIYSFDNPEFYVAGYFISKFFTVEKNYTKPPPNGERLIDTYKIS